MNLTLAFLHSFYIAVLIMNGDRVMTEEIVEETSAFELVVAAISSTDGAMVLLMFFWALLGFLRWDSAITEVTFKELFIYSAVVSALLKKI